jgi:2-alkyl-3-oxoalkanoate reductase
MKLLVTGASGFLGNYVVAEALRRGHQVRAVLRPSTNEQHLAWHKHPALELIRVDLRQQDGIVNALQDVEAVIHLAAAQTGDFDTRFAGTVTATENLLAAMIEASVLRLVAISTFSVYDYLRSPAGTTITEDTIVECCPLDRDVYAQTKLLQEESIREFEQNYAAQVTIVRPGLVYGKDRLWHSLLGAKLTDNLWLRIGADATLPLTYVENCADAIVSATEREEAIGQTINIVDDDLPTQSIYVEKLAQLKYSMPRTIPVNWTLMRTIAAIVCGYNKKLLKGQAKLPGLLNPAILDARFKRFCFSNARAKQILNWKPVYSLDTGLERSCSDVEMLQVPQSTPTFQPLKN